MIKKSTRGRPSVKESEEKQALYINIWTTYHFLNKTQFELAEMFNVSKMTIVRALKWVDKELLKLPPKLLLRGAIFAVKERLKRTTELFEKEYKKENPSIRSIVELNREIRNDQTLLLKLEDLYQEKFQVEGTLDTGKILEIITKEKKA